MKKRMILSIIGLGIVSSLQAATPTWVNGQVSTPSGVAIADVIVMVLENGQTSPTDSAGIFRIWAPTTGHLLFSHPSFQDKKVPINGQTSLQVFLLPATDKLTGEQELDECVVIGNSVKQKKIFLGAISQAAVNHPVFRVAQQSHIGDNMNVPAWNTENYATINESGYKEVYAHPLSTFSIDVDNASYSNLRRFLNQGIMPPVDAVRIEEMINYFDYNYEKPRENDPFSIQTEQSSCPWNSSHQLVLVGLQAKQIDQSQLPPSNLVFLIDVSGSMRAPHKLPLVKSALRMLVNELRPNDRVAIVVYAGAAGLGLASTPGNQKQKIMDAIGQLEAGGSTAGGEGLKLAYQTARANFIPKGNNRIILATDGDFNVGVSSTSEMERMVEEERESGIYMTVLGFGTGNIKDDKMETIADKGNGNYAYIDNLQEAQKVLINEFGGTLFTVAKDVKLQIEFNPRQVKAYRLIGYGNRILNDEDFNNDQKDAGEMGAGHQVTALYEIIPAQSTEKIPGIDELKYQQKRKNPAAKYSNELATVKARYKTPDALQSSLLQKIIPVSPPSNFGQAPENIRFASAVAGFGMLLRTSDYSGNLDYTTLTDIAQKAKGADRNGYRAELIRLMKLADQLSKNEQDQ